MLQKQTTVNHQRVLIRKPRYNKKNPYYFPLLSLLTLIFDIFSPSLLVRFGRDKKKPRLALSSFSQTHFPGSPQTFNFIADLPRFLTQRRGRSEKLCMSSKESRWAFPQPRKKNKWKCLRKHGIQRALLLRGNRLTPPNSTCLKIHFKCDNGEMLFWRLAAIQKNICFVNYF